MQFKYQNSNLIMRVPEIAVKGDFKDLQEL